ALIDAVELLRRRGFLVELKRLGNGRLHAEGQLIRLDPGSQGRGVGVVDAAQTIEASQQAELGLLVLRLDTQARPDERQRLLRSDVETNAGMLGAEVAGPMRPLAAATVARRRAQD